MNPDDETQGTTMVRATLFAVRGVAPDAAGAAQSLGATFELPGDPNAVSLVKPTAVQVMRVVGRLQLERKTEYEGWLRMSADTAHRRWWQIFEVVFGIPFLVAIALQFVLPLSFPLGFLAAAVILGGVAFTIVGAVLVILARQQFARHHQPTDPGHPTSQIITTGVFSISRNPLYLGGICILIGIGLALNLLWVLVLLLPALVSCYVLLVVPEERYLATKFGAEYHMYAASVHRWIGRRRRRRKQ